MPATASKLRRMRQRIDPRQPGADAYRAVVVITAELRRAPSSPAAVKALGVSARSITPGGFDDCDDYHGQARSRRRHLRCRAEQGRYDQR